MDIICTRKWQCVVIISYGKLFHLGKITTMEDQRFVAPNLELKGNPAVKPANARLTKLSSPRVRTGDFICLA